MITLYSMLGSALAVVVFSSPEQIVPTNDGMTWRYNMTEEAGPGAHLSDENQQQVGTLHAPVIYRVNGTRDVDGKKLLAFEMHRASQITNTDLLTVDEHGVKCWGRLDGAGQLTKLDPPQTIVAAPLTIGTTWDFDSEVSGVKVHQHYEIIGEGEITVPAGKFQGLHVHGEQTDPGPMIIDRWFVPGIGIVKDVTSTRSESGELLRKITLELTTEPKVADRPQVEAKPDANKLTVSIGQEAVGESRNTFVATATKICARWQGRGLRQHAKVRALWIAEEVQGVAPPDYTIDEANATATASDSHGVFTLARPEDGWTPGVYRVEFYVDGKFADAVKLKIAKSEASRFGPIIPQPVPTISPATDEQ